MIVSKDITEKILLKAGFKENEFRIFSIRGNNPIDIYHTHYTENGRHWICTVYIKEEITALLAFAYIQTIEHFNKLMELENIDFRLKEE